MNTDTDFIEIEQELSAPVVSPVVSFARSHRVMSAMLAIAGTSVVALTSCYALKSHTETIPRPKENPVFKLEDARPWTVSQKPTQKTSLVRNTQTPGTQVGNSVTLTFDDGPHPKYTPQILDFLKEHHLHGTFFLVGENVVRYPQLVKRIVAEGHQIGNHSWSHPKLTGISDEKVRLQIKRTHDAIVKACGVAPTLFRPPYGALKSEQRAWIEKEFHYTTLLWDIDTLDWTKTTSGAVASRIEHSLKTGSANVILSHDIHPRILPALQSLLPKLQARGFAVADTKGPVEIAGR